MKTIIALFATVLVSVQADGDYCAAYTDDGAAVCNSKDSYAPVNTLGSNDPNPKVRGGYTDGCCGWDAYSKECHFKTPLASNCGATNPSVQFETWYDSVYLPSVAAESEPSPNPPPPPSPPPPSPPGAIHAAEVAQYAEDAGWSEGQIKALEAYFAFLKEVQFVVGGLVTLSDPNSASRYTGDHIETRRRMEELEDGARGSSRQLKGSAGEAGEAPENMMTNRNTDAITYLTGITIEETDTTRDHLLVQGKFIEFFWILPVSMLAGEAWNLVDASSQIYTLISLCQYEGINAWGIHDPRLIDYYAWYKLEAEMGNFLIKVDARHLPVFNMGRFIAELDKHLALIDCTAVVHPFLYACPVAKQGTTIRDIKKEMKEWNKAPYASAYLGHIAILSFGTVANFIGAFSVLSSGGTQSSCLTDGIMAIMSFTGATCVHFFDGAQELMNPN